MCDPVLKGEGSKYKRTMTKHQLLKEEIILDMKLLGAKSIKELTPELLDMRSLHVKQAPRDMLYDAGYVPLSPPRFRDEPMEE